MDHYAYWGEYLAAGRNKNSRAINGSRTKRALRNPDDSITLRLHYTDVVRIYPDGSQVINTGGWRTVTTMRFLREYSCARVWSEGGQLYVKTKTPTYTTPKVSKCRRCKDGQQTQECRGPGWCHAGYGYMCEHGEQNSHRRDQCEHGQTTKHPLPPVICWQCKGVGRYDYGSKPVHYVWDGGPLLIAATGEPVGPVPAQTLYAPAQSKQLPQTSYRDSGTLLESVLPALELTQGCPAIHCERQRTITDLVIHLNDHHKWSREAIADWLETLDIDLTFPVPDYIPAHVH